MKTLLILRVMAGLALLSISAPSAFADDNDRQYGYNHTNERYRNNNEWNRNPYSNGAWQSSRRDEINNVNRNNNRNNRWNNNNSWNWEQHNWNDQRAQLRANWRRNDTRMSVMQQQLLDSQMRAQWLQYHNNNWNGQYTWDQYSDPQFLDYVHSRNPSLMTSLRGRFGL